MMGAPFALLPPPRSIAVLEAAFIMTYLPSSICDILVRLDSGVFVKDWIKIL